jgi:membrane peptidoglycan carboxypeptidase
LKRSGFLTGEPWSAIKPALVWAGELAVPWTWPIRLPRVGRRVGRIVRALPRWGKWLVATIVAGAAVGFELRTSIAQSWLFSRTAARATYGLAEGSSPAIIFPSPDAPYDRRLGYALIPAFTQRLERNGFEVREQARFSPLLLRLAGWNVQPPYHERSAGGLTLTANDGESLFDHGPTSTAFPTFDQVPDLVVRSLLFIENRELEASQPRRNPAIEWDRFGRAVWGYVGSHLWLPTDRAGGSTLATQLEKYRHSPDGRTSSGVDKLRQITGASLKAYVDGADTRGARRRIILDYLNSVPLAAAPGHGEVSGLGEGLKVWFGLEPDQVLRDLAPEQPSSVRAQAFKAVLTLLCAIRAPAHYLIQDLGALDRRVDSYARRLADAGVLDRKLAAPVRLARLNARPHRSVPNDHRGPSSKATNAVRLRLQQLLALPGRYEVDRLHLDVRTTVDQRLQQEATRLLTRLADSGFIERNGLRGPHLLSRGDPTDVRYSVLLYERTSWGNELRVQADNLDQPLDLNDGMKLDLGSTAKLRTLVHYLEVVERLQRELEPLGPDGLRDRARRATDPLTQWVATILFEEPGIPLDALLEMALDRSYSARPATFFTGGGLHSFHNFDPTDDSKVMTVRDALAHSTNLVFVRLMQDLVRYHEAHLPYDAEAVLATADSPERRRLLQEIGDLEAREALMRFYRANRGLEADRVIARLLGNRAASPRALALLFFAWHQGAGEEAFVEWLAARRISIGTSEAHRLANAYGNPKLRWSDYAYLSRLHPLELWSAGLLTRDPSLSWNNLLQRSGDARREASAWLFSKSSRRAQDRRLGIRLEQDAFARMTADWKRLGFPFDRLVPSLATAIGSSADRPAALAELMGILVNDGVRVRTTAVRELRFATGTPYETVFGPVPDNGVRLLAPEIAEAVRRVLAETVEQGTARRAAGTIILADKSRALIGGKTGSGDNRFERFEPGGRLLSSEAVNRTATFVFYVEDRYFGVITAIVDGNKAGGYEFTSALPVTIFTLLAPGLQERLSRPARREEPISPVASSNAAPAIAH